VVVGFLEPRAQRQLARRIGAPGKLQRVELSLFQRQSGPVKLRVPVHLGQSGEVDAHFAGIALRDLKGLAALGREFGGQHVFPERHGAAPRGIEFLAGSVTRLEPGVPFFQNVGAVILGQRGDLELQQRVLVVDLDLGHARLAGVGRLGIGIDVGQQRAGVIALHADHLLVDLVQALAVARQLFLPVAGGEAVGKVLALPVIARDVQVEVAVDSVALERGDEVIQPVELPRIELVFLRRARLPDAARRGLIVEVMEADAVHPEAGQPRREPVGGRAIGKAAREGEVGGEKLHPPALSIHEMAVAHREESVLARRGVIQPRNIHDRVLRRRFESRNHEGKHFLRMGDGHRQQRRHEGPSAGAEGGGPGR